MSLVYITEQLRKVTLYVTCFLKIVSNTAKESSSVKNQINAILKELKQYNVSKSREINTRIEKN